MKANDPTVKAIIEYFNIWIELIKELAESIVSIRVHGIKSVNTASYIKGQTILY